MSSLRCFTAPALLAMFLLAPAAGAREPASGPTEVRPLLIGAEVPSVTLTTPAGEALDLAEATKEKPAVLIFYRGGW